ncbi:LysR family transcriptional regulator [Paenibacillus sp. UMB4589-SE434]|uniref:LysR family transcriptional regulator n=1 Tax=Paenibacillus sp. UMB4589-SE434 TaxID=3046314 RepID=UPI002550E1D6|nr:LysR family transcriptional regulator [Paenibacillus sp. UMB4589-SE434]MDK8180478.1 LysR family transcriptional regulator [Paenibacillus sp. UMB4589-SE434]
MDIRQLRYFIAIAEEQNITSAARRLHIAQPPLSQQLKLMEHQLGVELIARRGRTLELTEAGRTLYKHALRITALMEESQLEVQETGAGQRGKLSIGVNTLPYPDLPNLLVQFRSSFPMIDYKIKQNESAHLCQLLRDRQIDLAIIKLPLELQDFSVINLITEPLRYIASPTYRYPRKQVTFAEMEQTALLVPSTEGLGLHHIIVEQFAKRSLNPCFICECSDIYTMLELVRSGFGAAIVPESLLQVHRATELNIYTIEDLHATSSTALIWMRDHYLSKPAQHFINMVKQNLSEKEAH